MQNNFAFPDEMPWYKSRIIVGILVSVVCKILVLVSATEVVDEAVQAEWVEVIVLLASFVADFVAARARVTQKAAPTLTS